MANFSRGFYPNSTYATRTIVANGDVVDQSMWVCPQYQSWVVLAASEVHAVAGSDPGGLTATLTKQTGTQTPATGTSLMNAAFNLGATAQTPQNGNLVASFSTRTLNSGDRLGIDITGTNTDCAGVTFTVYLYRIN